MGITRSGRFAAITNFRDPSDKRSTAPSRGGLVTQFLLGSDTAREHLARLAPRAREYNGFNLIVGDGCELFYFGSRETQARTIEPGVHGLSNHLLNEPWPKVLRAREAMRSALDCGDPAPPLFDMLSDRNGAPDSELPDTGVGLEWERRLAPPLITGLDYGSRASTVLAVTARGAVRLEERTRNAEGAVVGTAAFAFAIR
jgi:uncharacterized protein with NRDE domain